MILITWLCWGPHCISNCPILSMKEDPRPVSCKTDMINLDRQQVPIRMTSAAIINSDRTVTGFIETIEDIRLSQNTERVKGAAYSFANIVGRSHQMEKIFQTQKKRIYNALLNSSSDQVLNFDNVLKKIINE